MKNIYLIIPIAILSSCALIQKKSAEKLSQVQENNISYDAIIVPGCPFDGSEWSTTMKARVHWSVYLFNKGFTKNIIYSGSSVYSPYSESKIMALYAEQMGIPKENILIENDAEHSTENVYYSLQVAKKHGLNNNIALATDPFQSNSLNSFIRSHQLPIDQVPILFDTIAKMKSIEPKIDPIEAYSLNFKSIKDREGVFKRISGTFGKNIIWYEEDLNSEKLIKKYAAQGRLIKSAKQAFQN